MASRIEELRDIAAKGAKKIVLPESDEPRILKAAGIVASLGIADVILLGDEQEIRKRAKENSVNADKFRVINPKNYPERPKLVDTFYDLRKHKGITRDEAGKIVAKEAVYFAALLVRSGAADAFVAGASYTTRNVARAALHCLGLDEDIGVMSSSFLIELANAPPGTDGLFVFGDCGIVLNPNPRRLAGIALSSARLYEEIFKQKARVALLSYSTKGSAGGRSVEKVKSALAILKEKSPGLICDGEMQVDAAVVPEVSKIKSPGSPIQGRANVLIFPCLDAGNIAYKLIQRLGNARVVGPLLEGLARPASDLSRGATVEEIVDTVAATVIRAT